MINWKEKQTIIKLFLDGASQREIAKRTNKSRNTGCKYIKSYEKSRLKDIRNLPISEDVIKAPSYKKKNRQKKSVN